MSLTRRQLLALLAASAVAPTSLLAAPPPPAPSPPPGVERWEPVIQEFERRDRARQPAPGAVVFTGSSSIRKWSTLQEDMAPLRVLNRGFGGSHIPHCTWYAPRIVLPYKPRAVVLYAGDNDVAWGASPDKVLADLKAFVRTLHEARPGLPVIFLAIKPSPLRIEHWPTMQQANARVAAWIAEQPHVSFVDVASPLLDDAGTPRRALFDVDRLHLSPAGYAAWTPLVRQALAPFFPTEGATP